MILLKGILGGVAAVLFAWILILVVDQWLLAKSSDSGGLRSVAGGWNYLLQLPAVILLLSGAFAAGLFLTVRCVVRAKG